MEHHMASFSKAIRQLKQLKSEGFSPKLLWHMRKQQWFVAYVWLPKQNCFYERIELEKLTLTTTRQ